MTRPRDSQRSRLYAAENTVMDGRALPTVPELQAYADRVTRGAWWGRHGGSTRVTVRDGRGRRKAGAQTTHVKMPRWSRCELVLLHELVHSLVRQRYGVGRVASHGPEFARLYLRAVGRWMGPDAHAALRRAFDTHRVRYRVTGEGSS